MMRLDARSVHLFLAMCMVWGAGLLIAGCGTEAEATSTVAGSSAPAKRPPVDTSRVSIAPESLQYIQTAVVGEDSEAIWVRAPGRVEFKTGALSKVSAPVAGRVVELHVNLGDEVEVGDVLVTLHSPDASAIRAELASLRIALSVATAEFERQSEMLEKGIGVSSEHFAARMHVSEVKAELERAREAASFLGQGSGARVSVRASTSGHVMAIHTSVGANAEVSEEGLIEIGNPNAVHAVVDVFDHEVGLVRPGSRASLALAASLHPLAATVSKVGLTVDRQLRRVPVYMELDAEISADVVLRPGMFVRAEIEGQRLESVTVPVNAVLIRDGMRHIVFVQVDEHSFEPRDVEVGPTYGPRIQILSGLNSGETVVVRGALLLDGAASQMM